MAETSSSLAASWLQDEMHTMMRPCTTSYCWNLLGCFDWPIDQDVGRMDSDARGPFCHCTAWLSIQKAALLRSDCFLGLLANPEIPSQSSLQQGSKIFGTGVSATDRGHSSVQHHLPACLQATSAEVFSPDSHAAARECLLMSVGARAHAYIQGDSSEAEPDLISCSGWQQHAKGGCGRGHLHHLPGPASKRHFPALRPHNCLHSLCQTCCKG